MPAGEFALHQAVIRVATTLEAIRVICDRTHEENILAAREGRTIDLACHCAFAMGTVMAVTMQELERLQQQLGIRRTELHEEAHARAIASLASFKRSLQQLQQGNDHEHAHVD